MVRQFFRVDRYTAYALLLFAAVVIAALVFPKAIGSLGILIAIVGGYFLPTLVAHGRGVPNAGSVFVINLFLGWTLIGWVVALAMAARTVPPARPASTELQPGQKRFVEIGDRSKRF